MGNWQPAKWPPTEEWEKVNPRLSVPGFEKQFKLTLLEGGTLTVPTQADRMPALQERPDQDKPLQDSPDNDTPFQVMSDQEIPFSRLPANTEESFWQFLDPQEWLCRYTHTLNEGRLLMRRTSIALMLAGALIIPATAMAKGYEWRNHSAPFDYEFGNHIDTHQQSMYNDDGHLEGFLYITPGEDQDGNGIPDAKHGDCTKNPEGCEVGWVLHGIPFAAEYCGHNTGEHPTWAIGTRDLPRQRGFTHFHWENTPDNTDPHHGGLVAGYSYEGALLKLTAVATFDFNHHHAFTVEPGIDFETHANVIDDCEDFEPIGGDHTDH